MIYTRVAQDPHMTHIFPTTLAVKCKNELSWLLAVTVRVAVVPKFQGTRLQIYCPYSHDRLQTNLPPLL